jgi:hypothetical protein
VRPAGNVFTGLLRALVSWRFLTAVASLLMILLVAGALLWVFERRRNTEQFHPRPVRGLGDGLWWAAVTMTTVGYGDKAPATKGGRLVALVWMYASVIIISFFTAGIATSLTVGSLSSDIAGPGDLRGRPVGVITGSTGETTARQLRAKTAGFRGAPEALHALADGEVDAVVYDKPMLAYYAQSFPADAIRLLKGVIDRQDYAVALPPGSPLREPVNRAMLEYLNSAAWRDLQAEYLGEE